MCLQTEKKKFSTKQRSHLGPATGPVLILIKDVCFVINIVSVIIHMCIVIKIKRINSSNISDICDKLNFTTNYTHLQQLTHILLKHTQIL